MSNKFLTACFSFLLLFTLIVPVFSYAEDGGSGLVPCGTATPIVKDADGNETGGVIGNPCEWDDFMKLINNVVKFIFVDLALPISAIMFAYAGGLLMFSGGEAGKRTQAKKIFTNTVIGLVIVAGAWLIVHTVLSILGYTDAGFFGF